MSLSVICVFTNCASDAAKSLSVLYEHITFPFELFVYDDASSDSTAEAVQAAIKKSGHEKTFFFQNATQRGPAACYNDALTLATGRVVWFAGKPTHLDAARLKSEAAVLPTKNQAFAVYGPQLPVRPDRWLDYLKDGYLASDSTILVCPEHLPSHLLFVNPFQDNYFILEWILRTESVQNIRHMPDWICGKPDPTVAEQVNVNELLLSLVRGSYIKPSLIGDFFKPARLEKKSIISNELSLIERLIHDGEFNQALEMLDGMLQTSPGDPGALRLKVRILEKLKKYVEASELKKYLQTNTSPKSVTQLQEIVPTPATPEDGVNNEGTSNPDSTRPSGNEITQPEHQQEAQAGGDIPKAPDGIPRISLVLPTSTDGAAHLERCLLTLNQYADASSVELIVIDNASFDDTFEYLENLRNEQFFKIRIIKNKQNMGFAASVNQGTDAASGNYVMVLHNDVVFHEDTPSKLADMLDAHPDFGIIGPTLTDVAVGEKQRDAAEEAGELHAEKQTEHPHPDEVAYVDSCCMMFRRSGSDRFDEGYQLAWFEDIDFCLALSKKNLKSGICRDIVVYHDSGKTTRDLGVHEGSDVYWKNSARFQSKWKIRDQSGVVSAEDDPVSRLLHISRVMNPYYPEKYLVDACHILLTSETKNSIQETSFETDQLYSLILVLMATDERELLRHLEDRLDQTQPDLSMYMLLIRFYYDRNIYSRCLLYLNKIERKNEPFDCMIYRLKIALANKELNYAADIINHLMKINPVNPDLLKLCGDYYRFINEPEDAKKFYQLASQANPVGFPEQ